MNVNAPFVSTNGFIKADSGTLVLQQPYVNNAGSQSIAINGGTLRLAAGNNTIWTEPTATVPIVMTVNIPNGTLDLDGNSQLLGQLTASNPLPYTGGTAASPNSIIDNTTMAQVNLVSVNATAITFSGVIQNSGGGQLSFYRQGAGAITLTSPSLFTGSANFAGGGAVLQSMGSIARCQRHQPQQRKSKLGRHWAHGSLKPAGHSACEYVRQCRPDLPRP